MLKLLQLHAVVLATVLWALFPFKVVAQPAVVDRYQQALDAALSEVQREVAGLAALLDRATRHPGFVTGDLWNIPSGLYTDEYYWVLTNRYPFAPFWERAVDSRISSGNFAAHQANYRRVISGVDLLPGHGSLRVHAALLDSWPGFPGGEQSPMIRASLPEGVLNHIQRQLQARLQAAGLNRLAPAEQAALAHALERDSGLQSLLDTWIERVYLDGLDKLYNQRVSFGNLPLAERQQAGVIACLETPDDAFQPARHRALLDACDSQHLLSGVYAAYRLDSDNHRHTAHELFRDQALNIRFDLSYEPFVVSGYADERQRFSQLYDLEQRLQAQVAAGRAREEQHGNWRLFIDAEVGDAYPGVIAVDFNSGAGFWITPLYMAREDIAVQVERINTAIERAFVLSREAFDVMLDEFLHQYRAEVTGGAAHTDGF